jgi:hypothetical protein
MIKRSLPVLLVLLLTVGLFACASLRRPAKSPEPQENPPVIQKTRAVSPTQPPPPTPTPRPAKTQQPEVPATGAGEQNIATVIADPGPDFSNAWIYGVAHLENGYFLVTLDVPGGVDGSYRATLGNVAFNCMILDDYPSRLYCTGLTDQAGQFARLQLFEEGNDQVLFETEIGVPPVPLTPEQRASLARDKSGDEDEPPAAGDTPGDPYPYP